MGIFSTISDALGGRSKPISAPAAPKQTTTKSFDTLRAGRDSEMCAQGMTPTDGYSCGVDRAMSAHADKAHPTPALRK